MGVKIADKLEQFNNGTYYLVDSSAVEYVDKDGNTKSVKDVLDNGLTDNTESKFNTVAFTDNIDMGKYHLLAKITDVQYERHNIIRFSCNNFKGVYGTGYTYEDDVDVYRFDIHFNTGYNDPTRDRGITLKQHGLTLFSYPLNNPQNTSPEIKDAVRLYWDYTNNEIYVFFVDIMTSIPHCVVEYTGSGTLKEENCFVNDNTNNTFAGTAAKWANSNWKSIPYDKLETPPIYELGGELGGKVYTSLAELGLDTTATINDIIGAMVNGSIFVYKTDVFDYATEYNNIQYGTVTIHKQSDGRVQVLMTDKNTGNLYAGRMDTTNRIVGWRSESFHRVVAQATAGYFKFKPTSDGGFDQPLRISVTDNYGGMINISGAKPSSSQYKPFKCIRLSYGEYSNYDAMKLANNKMLKLFYYDGYFYLKVTTYTTCTFTGLIEVPTYVETFNETDAEEIPIRSVFDTPYNDGYADPSIICIGDADSSDGVIKTLSTLGFTEDVMTWDTGVYRVSHVAGITNLPAEITEEKPGFRLEHHDVKKWGNNHNPHVSTYGCRQSVLHYKGDVFVRYTESGATAGVLITDTGWQKLAKVYTTLAELGLEADATVANVIKALPIGGKAIISTHEFTNYQTLFPYSAEADQYATLKVEKGYDAAGSRTIVAWVRKDASRIVYGGLDATNTVKWWNEVSINGVGSKALVTNAQNFKLDITKKNANYFGFFKLTYLYGYHLCEICIGISSTIAYTVTKGKNLIDKITYTENGANIVLGIDFTTKVYGVQVIEMPTDFGRINSLTAESFTGSTVVNQTGLDLELYKQTKVVTSLDKGTWQVGQRIKQKTDFTASTNDVNFEFVAKNESSSSTGKYQKMTIYQLTPIENGTNASTSYSVFEDGKAQVTVWPATQNMPRNDYNIACEGYVNNGGAFNGQAVKSVTIDLSADDLQNTANDNVKGMSLSKYIAGTKNIIKVEGYYNVPSSVNSTRKKIIIKPDTDIVKPGSIVYDTDNWYIVVYGSTTGAKGSGFVKIYYVE